MKTTILATNYGTHSAADWSQATTKMVFQIDPNMSGERLAAAQKLHREIEAMLTGFYDGIIDDERQQAVSYDSAFVYAQDQSKMAAQGIGVMAIGTPWERQLGSQGWQNDAADMMASHFRTAQQVERQWHQDNLRTAQEEQI